MEENNFKINIEKVKEIWLSKVDEFAEQVAPVYKVMNWTWLDNKRTPSEEEIKTKLRDMIINTDNSNSLDYERGTGGITIGYRFNKEKDKLNEIEYYCSIEIYIRFDHTVCEEMDQSEVYDYIVEES